MVEKGFLAISQVGCYGCHEIKGFEKMAKLSVDLTGFSLKDIMEFDFGETKVPRTWADWTAGKLRDPQQYLTEKTTSRMPKFQLSEEEIHSLVVFLKGMRKEEPPPEYIMSDVRPMQKAIEKGLSVEDETMAREHLKKYKRMRQ